MKQTGNILMNARTVSYEEHQRRREAESLMEPKLAQPPVPAALCSLSDNIERLSKVITELQSKLDPVSSAPNPELTGSLAPSQQHGTSEFVRRICDSRDRVDNLIEQVQRIISKLEI